MNYSVCDNRLETYSIWFQYWYKKRLKEKMFYRKLYLPAKWLGVVPLNIFYSNRPKMFMKWFNILLSFAYLVLSVYCLLLRYLTFAQYNLSVSTFMAVDLIVWLHDFLSQTCIFVMTHLYRIEWKIFLKYLQKNSKDFEDRDGQIDIGISIFALFGSVTVNLFQHGFVQLQIGYFNPAYYSYYICNIYQIFVCTFLSHMGNILIRHQKKILVNLKQTKKYLINNNVTKIIIEFTNICINIKNLNLLYGWQILFIFTGGIVNILTFINFMFLHNAGNQSLSVSDLFRIVFYLVSKIYYLDKSFLFCFCLGCRCFFLI